MGKELCKILYQHNGTVYVAGRSQSKADAAIAEIKQAHPNSDGRLEFLHVDLADLPTIKKSVEDFQNREQRLDVLTNSKLTLLQNSTGDYFSLGLLVGWWRLHNVLARGELETYRKGFCVTC